MEGVSGVASLFAEPCREFLGALGIKGGATGADGEGLKTALSWALAALVLYLVLSAALRLLAALAGRVLWLAKLGLFLLGCAYVVATCQDEGRRSALLLGLLALYLLVGRVGLPFPGGDRRDARLEAKVSSLERQVEEMKRTAGRRKRGSYDYDYD
uniref:voltage-gated monoatomic cation channel TMEM109-like n=1 Tax=Pristiophorus japonicus TaxID=55135 RepID=UPI00398F4DA0